ncbi:MAG: hypothetical protein KJ626_15670 [Verrucomicrobia bacterium]|nr:hypothetical protein [Verrucomicrobiota bacterium]
MELVEILLDERGGAQELLLRAVAWLQKRPESLIDEERTITLKMLRTARPVMFGFSILADRLEAGSGDDDPQLLKLIEADIRSANVRAATKFAEKIREIPPCSIVTLSRSSSVLHGLRMVEERIEELHVLESQPGGEGKRLAEDAEDFCRGVLLHPDDMLREAVEMADIGLMGADTVFSDGGVLNKVLSVEMAEALKGSGKPLYVLASSWKRSTKSSETYEVTGSDARVFEVVPPELITDIFDDT